MHFLPKFELVVWMPSYDVIPHKEMKVLHTRQHQYTSDPDDIYGPANVTYSLGNERYIEASVEGSFVVERLAKGNVTVRWFAKRIDYQTPMYNDTVSYREVCAQIQGTYNSPHVEFADLYLKRFYH